MQPKEEVFQKAKRIILNQELRNEEFQILAKEIKEEWNSDLVNGDIYEYVQMTNPMRLRLIFRKVEDLISLPKLWNERQELIGELFKRILKKSNPKIYTNYDLSILEVDYFPFEELAFQECVNKVDTRTIQSEFKDYQLWSIQRFWKYFTVFYDTNEEVQENERLGISERIKLKFQEVAKKNDQFAVLKDKTIEVKFDSKENFDKAGGGYNYYR